MNSKKKQLIGAHNIENFIQDGKLTACGSEIILTPGAKDILRNKGISICYEKPLVEKKCAGKKEEMSVDKQQKEAAAIIIRLLRQEYGIDNSKELQAIAVRVLERMATGEK